MPQRIWGFPEAWKSVWLDPVSKEPRGSHQMLVGQAQACFCSEHQKSSLVTHDKSRPWRSSQAQLAPGPHSSALAPRRRESHDVEKKKCEESELAYLWSYFWISCNDWDWVGFCVHKPISESTHPSSCPSVLFHAVSYQKRKFILLQPPAAPSPKERQTGGGCW